MCLTEFDEEVYKQILREDSYDEGLADGLAAGETTLTALVSRLVADNHLDDLRNLAERKDALYREYGIK